jgi:hypothetical protein
MEKMNAAHSQHMVLSSSSERNMTRTVGLHGFEDNFNPRMDEPIQQRAETVPATIPQPPANDDMRVSAIDKMMLATEISMRYHKCRKQHYDGVYKFLVFSTLMLSAAAFLLNLTHHGIIGFAIIGLGVVSLVWNFSHKAREHDVLLNQHAQLLESIRLTHQPTMDHAKQWRMQRMTIQSKEPPIYWAVMNDCTYDVARAWDLKPKKRGCPTILRPFMNWIRF